MTALPRRVAVGCLDSKVPDILIVEDDDGIRAALVEVVEDFGYLARNAVDGAEALAEMRREPPRLVVTDLRMPRLNGWELIEAMRSEPLLRRIPVVAMSASPAGADALLGVPVLSKPL